MLPKWLAWVLAILLALGITGALLYMQARGVPLMGVHGVLFWIEVLLVPVTLLMTLVVYLRGRKERD